jgi:hypothetical protein
MVMFLQIDKTKVIFLVFVCEELPMGEAKREESAKAVGSRCESRLGRHARSWIDSSLRDAKKAGHHD